MWIIGVDGGGTKCKASLFDSNGNSIAQSITGSANLFTDFDNAIKNVNDACNHLLTTANKQLSVPLKSSDCFLSLGCAGASISSVQDGIANWQHPYAKVALTTDIHISCLAANKQKDCALIITGTGSCIAVYQHNTIKQFGGHGFLLGDIASGAWLGKNAVSWYLQSLERKVVSDPLKASLTAELGDDVNAIIQSFGHARSVSFGELVPIILSVQNDSEVVKEWIAEGLNYLSDIIIEHTSDQTEIFIDGGIARVYQQNLAKLIQREVKRPHQEAVEGAFAFAMQCIEK